MPTLTLKSNMWKNNFFSEFYPCDDSLEQKWNMLRAQLQISHIKTK